MPRLIQILSLTALAACGGDKNADTSDDNGGTTDGSPDPILFAMNYFDGFTGEALVGAEVCVVLPEDLANPCNTTDENGSYDWLWEEPTETDILHRFTLDAYFTTLYLGYYDELVQEFWDENFADEDKISINYNAFSQDTVDLYFSTGGLTAEAGKGHLAVAMNTASADNPEGATATVTDASGAEAGTVVYSAASGSILDASLTATSASGFINVANLDAGTYTVTVSHPTLTCEAQFIYSNSVSNVFTVPVEADTLSLGSVFCAP